jgi:hypothetical protein
MRLLHPEDMPPIVQGIVCRQSRVTTFFGSVLMLAMMVGMPSLMLWRAHGWWWLDAIAAMVGLLLVKWIVTNACRTLQSTNWLMQVSPDSVWINIRSYANRDFAPAQTVIELPIKEIKCVGELIQKRIEHISDRKTRVTERFLEIRCTQPVPSAIKAEIADERRRFASGSAIGGLITYSSRAGHQSVTVPEDDLIRIAWRNQTDWIAPSPSRTLREFQGRTVIAGPVQTDFTRPEKISPDQLDGLILRLIESNDRIAAIKLLQEQRGYSTTDANKFVKEVVAAL